MNLAIGLGALIMLLPIWLQGGSVAFGQQQGIMPPQGVEVIDAGDIVMGLNFFFDGVTYTPNLRLVDYTLYPNGTVVFVFEGSPRWLDDFAPTEWTTPVILEVRTTHRFTPENGYTYNTNGILTPEGKLLVIETE